VKFSLRRAWWIVCLSQTRFKSFLSISGYRQVFVPIPPAPNMTRYSSSVMLLHQQLKRRTAAAVFATRISPLVSRSSRLTIETCPPPAFQTQIACVIVSQRWCRVWLRWLKEKNQWFVDYDVIIRFFDNSKIHLTNVIPSEVEACGGRDPSATLRPAEP
jgi:hypothetical protein